MNKTQIQKLNALQRLYRRMTLDPLLRTKLIWIVRVWIVSILQCVGAVLESIIKVIAKIILVILAAIFFM